MKLRLKSDFLDVPEKKQRKIPYLLQIHIHSEILLLHRFRQICISRSFEVFRERVQHVVPDLEVLADLNVPCGSLKLMDTTTRKARSSFMFCCFSSIINIGTSLFFDPGLRPL